MSYILAMTMRHRLIATLTLILISRLHAAARADSLDDHIRAVMQWQRIPGLSLAVMKNGKVIRSGGYGFANLETQASARPDTVYKIGSLSKQFLAAGILVLVQDGKLQLDAPVRTILTDAPEAWQEITIRRLLTHTAGLVRDPPGFDPYKVQPDAEVVASTYPLPLRFAPGTKWAYSNSGYYVLAEVILKVTGEPWTTLVARRVLQPAGLGATRTTTLELVPKRARGYEAHGGVLQNAEDWLALRPSGAYLSTVLDLAKWDAALDTDVPLAASTRTQMWTPVVLAGGQSKPYGFGWFTDSVQGHRRVHHDGGVPGFVSELQRFPDDGLSVVILANISNRDLGDLALDIAGHILPALLPPPAPAIADPGPAMASRLFSFVRALGTGRPDPSLLTAKATSALAETLGHGLPGTLRELGVPAKMELLEEKAEGENRIRRYRVSYPHLTLFATFTITPDNHVEAWGLTD